MAAQAKRAAHLAAQASEVRQVGLYGGIFAHSALARQLFAGSMASFSPALAVKTPEYLPELGALSICTEKRRAERRCPVPHEIKLQRGIVTAVSAAMSEEVETFLYIITGVQSMGAQSLLRACGSEATRRSPSSA